MSNSKNSKSSKVKPNDTLEDNIAVDKASELADLQKGAVGEVGSIAYESSNVVAENIIDKASSNAESETVNLDEAETASKAESDNSVIPNTAVENKTDTQPSTEKNESESISLSHSVDNAASGMEGEIQAKWYARVGKAIARAAVRTYYAFMHSCKEVGIFFSNPVRYYRAYKGKTILMLGDLSAPLVHDDANLLEVSNLKKYFPIKRGILKHTIGYVRAVDGISFNLKRGTTMGLVGESGCGKTTVGRTILRLTPKSGGKMFFDGTDLSSLNNKQLRAFRPRIQIVFQDPYSSLSPRMPVGEIIGEAVRQHNIVPPEQFDEYVSNIMRDCGLQEYHKNRYPHEFSGGQRQRICIARALALDPEFIVCDEPVSALDVSIQAQIINLLKELQRKYNLTYLFISHDLSVVEHISDTVGVMYLGNLVEYSTTDKIFSHPLHPYTEALFSAIPVPDPDYKMNRIILEGTIPSPANPPKGCKFHTRCRDCREICKHEVPPVVEAEEGHFVACHKLCSTEYADNSYQPEEKETIESVMQDYNDELARLKANPEQNKNLISQLTRSTRKTLKRLRREQDDSFVSAYNAYKAELKAEKQQKNNSQNKN